MQQWEYRSFLVDIGREQKITVAGAPTYGFPSLEAVLDDIGAQGWELVASENHRLVFKRPKEAQDPEADSRWDADAMPCPRCERGSETPGSASYASAGLSLGRV